MKTKKVLSKINNPEDVKKISEDKLPQLCEEVREFLIDSVSKTGGHFGSNLGAVELTVALHRVFDAPKDLLIWDVGHQTYSHKILTGRKKKLNTIRQKDGLAPFPKRSESKYDTFDVGHSSTSISAAMGMSIANKNKKTVPQVIAIIGDGALTGGMAFEALNHAGGSKANLLVILNDNKMSISPNVGAVSKYLTKLTTSRAYAYLQNKKDKLPKDTRIRECAHRVKIHIKGAVRPKNLFEDIGFKYYGPVDGHDIESLVKIIKKLKNIKGPKFLHVRTVKGRGYKKAETDKCCLHATGSFDLATGKSTKKTKKQVTYTDVFAGWICEKGKQDKKVQVITPAMCEGSGLVKFREEFPDRYHDVGIAEQHAVTFAAGLACQGVKPVVAIYSSFLQRAYDQLIHDVALQNLDVLFAIDRAGVVGPDGATHAGSFDLSFMRIIPNLIIMVPSSLSECHAMLELGYSHKSPVAVRYPRGGSAREYKIKNTNEKIEIGKAKIRRRGQKVAILAFGVMVDKAQIVSNKLDTTLVDMRFVKPIDGNLLKNLSKTHKYFVTVEDNVVAGGAGSAVNEFVLSEDLDVKVKNIGLPDKFLPHGTREEILAEAGLDVESILKTVKNF